MRPAGSVFKLCLIKKTRLNHLRHFVSCIGISGSDLLCNNGGKFGRNL